MICDLFMAEAPDFTCNVQDFVGWTLAESFSHIGTLFGMNHRDVMCNFFQFQEAI